MITFLSSTFWYIFSIKYLIINLIHLLVFTRSKILCRDKFVFDAVNVKGSELSLIA
jgi:hypothetical protein